MIRQTIVLGEYTYIVDLHKASSDINDGKHFEEFVMIRKTDIMNSIMYDKDVFFISRQTIDSCTKNGVLDAEALSQIIAYPVTNNGITLSYSTDYKNFNKDLNSSNFKVGYDIIEIFDRSCTTPANVLCDRMRVWLPINNSKLNAVIHVSNTINDIKFHYICQRSDSYETDSNGEIYVGNNIYSEYFDIWVPNAEYLFGQSNCYIKEEFNISEIKQKIFFKKSPTEVITIEPRIFFELDGEGSIIKKMKLSASRSSFDLDGYEVCAYDNEEKLHKLEWNIVQTDTYETEIKEGFIGKILVMHDGEIAASYDSSYAEMINVNRATYVSLFLTILPFYIEDYSFDNSLFTIEDFGRKSKLYCDINEAIVDDSLISPLIVQFYKYDYIDDVSASYIQEYDTQKNADIFTMSKDIKLKAKFGFCDDKSLKSYGAMMLYCQFSCSGIDSNDEDELNAYYLRKSKSTIYDYMSFEDSNDSFDTDVFPEEIEKCGFIVEMSTDSMFTDIVYKFVKNMNIDNAESHVIADCSFGLNFVCGQEQWDSYPETLVIRARFVDKVSFNSITSNKIFVTKEVFKYLINGYEDKIEYRLALRDANKIYDDEAVDFEKFNFIDKISCIVVKNDKDDSNKIENAKTNAKIIYKPIFFKVKDLQQIKLKSGISQNIGLNLSDYLTKVDTFKISINGKEYPETARNDGYVIFKINALELSSNAGQYNLLNQDDEYISDGTWYIY